ncbi:MAG: S8 family peptidase [Lysinibacillus sp.]
MVNVDTKLRLPTMCISSKVNTLKDEMTRNVFKIGADSLWREGFTGKGVVVAVLDTGCDTTHEDLTNNIIGGYNFSRDHGRDINIYEDLNGHGTHVAGVIAASRNGTGIIGVAPDAKLLILKVLNREGGGSIGSLIEAIYYAINWRGSNGERVDILSLSLGSKHSTEELHMAVKDAVTNNIAVVVASGNNGDGDIRTDEYNYPAGYAEVISVGAITAKNSIALFSNTNEQVDIYAPGVSIKSSYINGGYVELSGTSMATPHVVGALALLINKYESVINRKPTELELFNYLMMYVDNVQIADEYSIPVLNLAKSVSMEEEVIDKELLLKCFCEARKTQAFFTKCLNENSSKKEREFILSLIQESTKTSNLIRNFCKISTSGE